jgi:hypothetical protein
MAAEESSVISQDLRETSKPDRNLALELVRVTEAAASRVSASARASAPRNRGGGVLAADGR